MKLYKGDCIEIMNSLPSQSIDFILTDLPYNTTSHRWDTLIPFAAMWDQIWRLVKPKAAVALFGGNPFQANLIMSQAKYFKYEWIWDKMVGSNFADFGV